MTKPSATNKKTALAARAAAAPAVRTANDRKAGVLLQPSTKSVAKAGIPGAPVTANTGDAVIIKPTSKHKEGEEFLGVGGQLSVCRLAMVVNGGPSSNNFVDFELAPARRSTYDRQGQSVPGANAGMEFDIEPATAILPVPGGRPIHQGMGIKSETIEFVGAFIAHDEFYGASDTEHFGTPDNAGYLDSPGGNRHLNAWERSQKLAQAARQNREMILQMGWVSPGGPKTSIYFEDATDNGGKSSEFRVRIKRVKRIYATQQRVYYRVVLSVTNREDLWKSPYAAGNTAFEVPSVLTGQLGLRTESVYVAGDAAAAAEVTSSTASTAEAGSGETYAQQLDRLAVVPEVLGKYLALGPNSADKDVPELLEQMTTNPKPTIVDGKPTWPVGSAKAARIESLLHSAKTEAGRTVYPYVKTSAQDQEVSYLQKLEDRAKIYNSQVKFKTSKPAPDIKPMPRTPYTKNDKSAEYDPTGRTR